MEFDSFRQVIDHAGGPHALATEIDVKANTLCKWHERDVIRPEYWLDVVAKVDGVTLEDLAQLYRERERGARFERAGRRGKKKAR